MRATTYTCAPEIPLEREIEQAFLAYARDAATCAVLVLPKSQRPPRELVPAVVEGLARTPALTDLVLVHENASIGFMASTISLRAARARVRSVAAVEELDGIVSTSWRAAPPGSSGRG